MSGASFGLRKRLATGEALVFPWLGTPGAELAGQIARLGFDAVAIDLQHSTVDMGEAAKQVGNIMKELSASHQLISITHQPQIAAKADAHYFVYKAIEKDTIVTSIRLLNNDERITTIAQMLSGEKPTAAALQNAREMVGN